jgi:DNA-binding cell septation regulator SpoVG
MNQTVVRVDSVRRVDKGSLRAFATVTIAGKLTIHSIRIVQQAGQAAWVSLPQSEVKAADGGKSKYFPIVEIGDAALKDQVINAVLAAYHAEQAQQSVPAGWGQT